MLSHWLEGFILYMERRGYTERSQKCYRNDLRLFVKWVAEKGQPELDLALLEEYQMHLCLRPTLQNPYRTPRSMGAASRNRHVAELRSFFRYLKREGLMASNPAAELEMARQPKRLPKGILSVPEVERLIGVIPDSVAGLRDRAGVELLYGTGIRRLEFCRLNTDDVRLSEGLAHIWGKGNKDRVVPLGETATVALRQYLEKARPALLTGKSHRSLFVSAYHGGPLSDQEFSRVLKGYARRAGIKKTVAFHVFRHSVATHLLQRGADLRAIQCLLGHARLDTTALYTRVEISDLQKTLKRCHPRETDLT